MTLYGAEKCVEKIRKRRRWRRTVACLAAVVVLGTSYAMSRPAVTLTDALLSCGLVEHEHTEKCYDAEGVLICRETVHAHTEACGQETPEVPELQADTEAAVPSLLSATPIVSDNDIVNDPDCVSLVWTSGGQTYTVKLHYITVDSSGKKYLLGTDGCGGHTDHFNNEANVYLENYAGHIDPALSDNDHPYIFKQAWISLEGQKQIVKKLSFNNADYVTAKGWKYSSELSLEEATYYQNVWEDWTSGGSIRTDAVVHAYLEYEEATGYTVAEAHDAVKIRLYDYGSYITQSTDDPFYFYDGNRSLDGSYLGTASNAAAPTMSATLGSDGYPVANSKSLKFLFGQQGFVTGSADPALSNYRQMRYEARDNLNGISGYTTGYQSMGFDLKGDGGLFTYNPETGWYEYDSAEKSAYYDINTNRFLLNETLISPGHDHGHSLIQDGNFLPFDRIPNDPTTRANGSKQVYDTGTGTAAEKADLGFGIVMETEFYMPAGGVINGQAMQYEFLGDDDVWVYVDDVLVLNIGGCHGAQSGTINFATGEVTSGVGIGTNLELKSSTLKAVFEAAGKDTGGFTGNTFADWTSHTMKFYYLERGGNISYCKMKFNLPTLPEKGLTVQKTLAVEGGDQDTVDHLQGTMEYRFRVLKANRDGSATDTLLIRAGDKYTRKDGTTGTVGTDGIFTLKHGETATFDNMMARFAKNESYKYVVQELMPSGESNQYNYTIYNNTGEPSGSTSTEGTVLGDFRGITSGALDASKANIVNYTNRVNTTVMGTLKVTKTVEESTAVPLSPQTYFFRIYSGPSEDPTTALPAGTPYTVTSLANTAGETKTANANGLFALKDGETLSLRLLTGTYFKVVEVDAAGTEIGSDAVFTVTYQTGNTGHFAASGQTLQVTAVNAYSSGSLTLKKQVVNTSLGTDTAGEFIFALQLQSVPAGWTGRTFPMTRSNGSTAETLAFDVDGKATVTLNHNESVIIGGLPLGLTVSITEQNVDGYSVSWQSGGNTVSSHADVSANLTAAAPGVELLCVNTTGYELPATGGAGTGAMYAPGTALTLAALGLLAGKIRKKEVL